ncbi:MAG: glycine--tRNA ligase subunit beta [Alphaproteobacteria bacterium]|nr:glycine--tRNA ligase subunit beta [Alphaproteobacteria bacterium]
MAELLLELFSEEIPARMQKRAAEDLKKLVTDKLAKADLEFALAEAHVTPRRLALVIDGLPEKQPDVSEERRGPRVDAPEKAIAGFLGSIGLTRNQVEEREMPKGTFLFAVIEKTGAETRGVLPGIILEAIQELPWQKSMRWARNSFRWVRPLHHVLAIFGGKTLDGSLALGDWTLDFTDTTRGHRFLAPDAFSVTGFADYRAKLRDALVVLDREERKKIIADGASTLAKTDGMTLKDDPGLLEEVCGLVEWPAPLMGRIEDAFMEVPPEALVTAMRTHQKYFALETADGALAPRFITVSNMKAEPARDATIVAGNEKVLRARLSDARFFWDQDRAETLEIRVPTLASVTFYDKLGTLADKMSRVEDLAGRLAAFVPDCDAALARRATKLAKADLTTEMVGEFPELQGIMGRYYARHDGEPEAVCAAISEHYAPQGPSDGCPTAPISVAVALADKIDTLVGFFAIDERPTGSRDPFALRRAALGVIRLIMENNLAIPLRQLFGYAYDQIGVDEGLSKSETTDALLEFLADRLKVHLREQGVRHDLITAIFALGDEDDLNRLIARVEALSGFLASENGTNLLIAYRRAANIVRIEATKDGRHFDDQPDASRFEQDEEKALWSALDGAHHALEAKVEAEDFVGAMGVLADLRAPIDAYFDQVTVNVDQPDLRENRLRTLAGIVATMNPVADFSAVEG